MSEIEPRTHESTIDRQTATSAAKPSRWRTLARAAIFGTLSLLSYTTMPAATEDLPGRQLFEARCTACHTIGQGDRVGPDLRNVTRERTRQWLHDWISAPERLLAQRDPVATELLGRFNGVPMPNPGLGTAEVDAVIDYLAAAGTAASGSAAATPTAAAPALPGEAGNGKELFLGVRRFTNQGPACMACHSVAGIGALGGGELGPDLTTASPRLGGPIALESFLKGVATPVMRTVWSQRPLSEQERADLVAFLAQASASERPAPMVWLLAALSGLGLAILLALSAWIWRVRLPDGVRRPMLARERHTAATEAANLRRR